MGIVPDEVLFCVFYCSANDILQLSLARYDAKCFAHYMQLLFVLAPFFLLVIGTGDRMSPLWFTFITELFWIPLKINFSVIARISKLLTAKSRL